MTSSLLTDELTATSSGSLMFNDI